MQIRLLRKCGLTTLETQAPQAVAPSVAEPLSYACRIVADADATIT